jgi:hypothetical protein
MTKFKECFKCKITKPLGDFYAHKAMLDGYVNKCKECNKQDVTNNRNKKIDYYRDYDKLRANNPDRVAARMCYAKTETGKETARKAKRNYELNYPYKKMAVTAIGNAIKNKKIIRPTNCQVCDKQGKIHAHHDDYTKPYDVRWLCIKCHVHWHKHNKPFYPFLR